MQVCNVIDQLTWCRWRYSV